MPRVSKQLAAENKKNIEKMSSHLLRDKGFGVSVTDLMHAVGLTHGGFYKHFQNKDELIDIACKNTFDQSTAKWEKIIQESDTDKMALDTIVERYLSEKNLENPSQSCPLSTLTIDVAREENDKPVKQSFDDGIQSLLKILTQLENADDQNQISEEAMVKLSLLSGALILARSVNHDLALNILDSVKQFLFNQNATINDRTE